MAKLDPHGTDYVLREVTLACREDLLALQNITMTLLKDTNCPVCRQIDPIKIMADEDHTLGAVLPIGWLPPHNRKCQGKVKLLGKEGNFKIDPNFRKVTQSQFRFRQIAPWICPLSVLRLNGGR